MNVCKTCRFWSRENRCLFYKFEPPSDADDAACKNFVDKKSEIKEN
jgi:hypothetical protein